MSIEISDHTNLSISKFTPASVSLYDSILSVPEADWSQFVKDDNPLLKPSYLKLLEDTLTGEMEFMYAVLRNPDGLLGICYFQVVRFKGTNLTAYFPKDNRGIKNKLLNLTRSLVAMIDMRLLVSGNLFITGEQGISFLSPVTDLEKSFHLAHTIDHIFRVRKYIKAVLLPDMYEPAGDFDTAFLRNKYQRIFVEADMSMTLPHEWKSFDDYMAAISSKYRIRAKKVLQNSHQLTSCELGREELEAQLDRFFELYRAVADKADFNIAKLPKAYYPLQKKLSPDMYKVFGYYLDGRMVGFMSLFILPHKTEVHYCGIDYTINKEHGLYQRMLYDVIRYAAEHNLRKLHFGRTAPEVKSTIGAIPHPMYGYLRHRNRIINSFMGLFTGRLKPREYILRNPFK